MAVTIYDIARKANLSHATVSMALRGLPKIKAETRARVQNIAREMGYIPNQAAVALKTGNSNMIALILPTLNVFTDRRFIEEIKRRCSAEGWDIFMFEISSDVQEQRRILKYIRGNDYLAVVTALYEFHTVRDIIEEILSAHCPIVVKGAPKDLELMPGMMPLTISNEASVRACIEELLSRGHRNIVHTVYHNTPSHISDLIRSTLEEHGIRDWNCNFYCGKCDSVPSAEDGWRNASKLLEDRPGVTAVQCFNDQFAFGLMKGLLELGVKVPEDISICGSDNTFISKYNSTPISSIDMGQKKAAQITCDFLKKQLETQDWETPVPVQTVFGEFIMRETTADAPEEPFLLHDRESSLHESTAVM